MPFSIIFVSFTINGIINLYRGDSMEQLIKLAQGSMKRFPNGKDPFQTESRLLEECAEVASEINLLEDSGIKRQKHGEPKKENIAGEIRQAINALMQIALYYDVTDELQQSMDESLERLKKEGLV